MKVQNYSERSSKWRLGVQKTIENNICAHSWGWSRIVQR